MIVKYDDLEDMVRKVYDEACTVEVAGDSAVAKMFEVRLRAIRTMAELREKASGPAELDEFRKRIDELEKLLERTHRAQPAVARAPETDRTSKPPSWRQ